MRSTRPFAHVLPLLAATMLAVARPSAAQDWTPTTLPNGFRYTLAVAPNGDVYAFGGDRLRVSTDEGATWNVVGPVAAGSFPHSFVFSPSGALFAADDALGVYRSDDAGLHWTTTLTSEGCNSLAAAPGDIVFAGLTYTGNGKVHRSVDLGGHWAGIALPGASTSFATECFGFGDSAEVYAGAIDGFYRSADLGVTWEAIDAGFLGPHVRTMVVAPDQRVYVQTLYPAQFDGLYRSADRGRTWLRLPGAAPYFSRMVAAPDGTLWGASGAAVYRSSDGGEHWSSVSAGIGTSESLGSLVVTHSGRLLTGGYRVYRGTATLLDAGGPVRAPAIELAAAQPNPFPRATRIGFTLARAARIELDVFDVTGRRVAALARGERAAGAHAVTFDAAGLPAGLYRCQLAADGIACTRSLVVMH